MEKQLKDQLTKCKKLINEKGAQIKEQLARTEYLENVIIKLDEIVKMDGILLRN